MKSRQFQLKRVVNVLSFRHDDPRLSTEKAALSRPLSSEWVGQGGGLGVSLKVRIEDSTGGGFKSIEVPSLTAVKGDSDYVGVINKPVKSTDLPLGFISMRYESEDEANQRGTPLTTAMQDLGLIPVPLGFMPAVTKLVGGDIARWGPKSLWNQFKLLPVIGPGSSTLGRSIFKKLGMEHLEHKHMYKSNQVFAMDLVGADHPSWHSAPYVGQGTAIASDLHMFQSQYFNPTSIRGGGSEGGGTPGAFNPNQRAYDMAQWYAATSPAVAGSESKLETVVNAQSIMDNFYMKSATESGQIFTPCGFSRAVPYGKYFNEEAITMTSKSYRDQTQALVALLATGPPVVDVKLSTQPATMAAHVGGSFDELHYHRRTEDEVSQLAKGLRTYSIRWRLPQYRKPTIGTKIANAWKKHTTGIPIQAQGRFESRNDRDSEDVPVYLHVTVDYSVARAVKKDFDDRIAVLRASTGRWCVASDDSSNTMCSGNGKCILKPAEQASPESRAV